MLFHSSFRNELGRYFWATLVVLVTIVMTVMLIRTLGQASGGKVDPQEVSLVLAFTMLANVHSLLTMSLYIATVATMSRMYTDSEMVIWQSSGQSTARLLRPALRFAWPWLLTILALALCAWPWSNSQILDMRERYEKRGDLERIKSGEFQESANGKRVFFIDNQSQSARHGSRVFIFANEQDTQSIITSETGFIDTRDGERFLVLNQGQRVDINPAKEEIKVIAFESHGSRVESAAIAPNEVEAQATQPWELWRNPTPVNLSELTWRLGLGLASFNLLLLAIAIPFINPRTGRSGSLIMAMITFFIYYNLVNLSRTWVASGEYAMGPMLVGMHLPVFLLAVLILYLRQQPALFQRARKLVQQTQEGER
ncbi:MAG: LPS export ABC transporter permease LptF [Betaproteobacteria bacterium]|nr:LPS export ABC transporter permease LptF [Betaproteobacteria bacterium]